MEDQQWLRHLLPLPREIDIADQLDVHPAQLRLCVTPDANALAEQAAAELRQLFADRAECALNGKSFTITLALADDQGRLADTTITAARLQDLPNREQADLIQPADYRRSGWPRSVLRRPHPLPTPRCHTHPRARTRPASTHRRLARPRRTRPVELPRRR